jgi:hypothetical protein
MGYEGVVFCFVFSFFLFFLFFLPFLFFEGPGGLTELAILVSSVAVGW